MSEPKPILVMIADDHPVVREGLAGFIDRQPDMRVVAEASDGIEAVEKLERCHPEVILLDLRMPRMGGIDSISAIRQKNPGARIIILSAFDGDENIYRSLRAGARGYLRKDASQEVLAECIRAVYQGKSWPQPSAAVKLANRMNKQELLPRETEVLRLHG
jgi:DNA-binding NarL/FixJ family response regulator